MEPKRIVILAHRTAAGPHLQRVVKSRMSEGRCHFTLIVPAQAPEGFVWTEHQAAAETQVVLDEALEIFRGLGADIEGIVGDRRPLLALDDHLRHDDADEIIVSTFSSGASRWLRQDLPHRVARTFDVKMTHVVDERMPADQGRRASA
ncbi:MAG TPA: hypothetical protein VM841_01125 [Actinomycetota bacterium]|nr:hypothetical protein [Actinomycetota bacterium]